jgi:transaldolase
MTDKLAQLSAAGVAVWLDDLSRERLVTGALDKLRREQHVVGVTTNPTIFAKALGDSDSYAEQVTELALRGIGVEEAVRMLTTYDVRWACDVMRPAYDASRGVDGRVSIEVDPRLAHDCERTVAEAKALWWLVDRPNLFIKIPATRGRAAVDHADARRRDQRQRHADLQPGAVPGRDGGVPGGLEQARENGHDLSKIGSVASFFVSRVDTEIDKRLDKIGTRGGAGAARQGRRGQRAARLPGVRAGLLQRPLAVPGRRRGAPAAAAVGVHVDQEPGLPRRDLRRGAGRPRAWSTPCRSR